MQSVLGESRATCRLTAAAVRGPRRQLLTVAHTSTASSAPDAAPRVLAEGRPNVGLYAMASVCVGSSGTGVPWTSCRVRVSRVLLLLWDDLYYRRIVLEIYPVRGIRNTW